jgi:hypothetical protein
MMIVPLLPTKVKQQNENTTRDDYKERVEISEFSQISN